jgi:hypothetical protein
MWRLWRSAVSSETRVEQYPTKISSRPFEVFSQGDATKHSVTMADVAAPNGFGSQQVAEKTAFEKQRDTLIGQITQVRTRCAFR